MSSTTATKTAEAVEKVTNTTPDAEVRTARRIEIGHAIHQGDVYLHRVADDHPRGKELGSRQVAVGTTVGSRHVVEGDGVKVFAGQKLPPGVEEPAWVQQGSILGPVVVAEGPFNLTHPEHAHHALPKGTYQVTYQADFATQQRVLD